MHYVTFIQLQKSWYKTKDSWGKIVFNRNSYDPFIDFLKGICIIFVIINHSMPEKIMDYTGFLFWGVSAVPIFLIIQVFHAYKKDVFNARTNFRRLFKKILWPFILCELSIFIIFVIKSQHTHLSQITSDLSLIIKSGGFGPGAYYPWIYIQFAILLPFLSPIFRLPKYILCIVFIIISQFAESACSYYGMPQLAYRLSFVRYIFIFYLGFILAYKGFVLNIITLLISILCLVITTFIVYSHIDFQPVLYTFVNPVYHWFCYIYIAYILLFLLKEAYLLLSKSPLILNLFLKAGRFSYDIFMFQIVYFATADDNIHYYLKNSIDNYTLFAIFRILLPLFICTTSFLLYKRIHSKHNYYEKVVS